MPITAQTTFGDTRIGIDIGGTGIKAGIVDPYSGQLVGSRLHIPTPHPSTPTAITEAISLLVDELSRQASPPPATSPVGVAFPGIIRYGIVRSSANLDEGWLGEDIVRLLAQRLDRPVDVINDADAAGLAEVRHGAAAGLLGTVLVITLGTGIGSALLFRGDLIPNAELGHLEIDGRSAESRTSAVARERHGLSWAEYARRLQRYLSQLEFLFSPDLLVIGGGISARADEYLPSLRLRTPVVPAVLRNDAGIIGAGSHVATTPDLHK
ncbi:polyphosphate--glucose phosphotransferase [Paenarthrobacter nicotinovorans]|uniref:polyphosphate--glucose phosphotransferase n=1 Tax=Paenarthrobacter nicotinovorans TaxID=29320 RepID=UPI0038083B45